MEYLFAFIIFALVFAGMAVGVIVKNRPLQGSCGGLGNFRDSVGNPICDACSAPCAELKREMKRAGHSPEEIAALVLGDPSCEHHSDD